LPNFFGYFLIFATSASALGQHGQNVHAGRGLDFPAAIPMPATRRFLPCGFSETEQADRQTPDRRFTFSAVNAASVEIGQLSDTANKTRMPVLATSPKSEDTRQARTRFPTLAVVGADSDDSKQLATHDFLLVCYML